MSETTVDGVMIHLTTAVRERTPAREVAQILASNHLPAVAVLDAGGRVTGIVTASNLLPLVTARCWQHQAHRTAATVAGPAYTVGPHAPVTDAVRLANQAELNALPVVDGAGALLGMVTRTDLASALLRADAKIRRSFDHQLAG